MKFRLKHLFLMVTAIGLIMAVPIVWFKCLRHTCITGVEWSPGSIQVFASVLHYEKRSGFLSSLDACDRIRTQDVVSLNPASHASEAIYQLNFSKVFIHHAKLQLSGNTLSYIKNQGLLAVANWTRGVSIIDTETNELVTNAPINQDLWNASVAIPSRAMGVIAMESSIYDVEDMGRPIIRSNQITSPFCFSPSGDFFATFSDNDQLIVYEVALNSLIVYSRHDAIRKPEMRVFSSLEYSTNGRYLFAGSKRGLPHGLCVWDNKIDLSTPFLVETRNAVWDIASNPIDETSVAVVSDEGGVAIIDLTARSVVRKGGEQNGLVCCSFSQCGQYLATGSSKGDVTIWDANTLKQLATWHFASDALTPPMAWGGCFFLWLYAWRRVCTINT